VAFLSRRFDTDIEQALAAVAFYATLEEAVEYLKTKGYQTTTGVLRDWRDINYPDRYAEVRALAVQELEEKFVGDLMDGARLADMVSNVAVARALKLLQDGHCKEPARVARDLQQVASQKVEKAMTISGRPSQIVEHRSFDEISRALVALGVARYVDGTADEEPPELEEGEA
jgi:hypothetical protein